jgi:hypothetical protein
MVRSPLLATLALITGACAPSTHAATFKQVAPKTSAQEVEVFTDAKPQQPYQEIGVIEIAAAELSNSRYGDLIERARAKAAEMGADAIIVTRDPKIRTTGFAYVPRAKRGSGQLVSASMNTVETPRIQVSAISWRTDGSE